MSGITKLPAAGFRVDTGPIQFGDDWPGLFMRGDNCGALASHLRQVLGSVQASSDPDLRMLGLPLAELRRLVELLEAPLL